MLTYNNEFLQNKIGIGIRPDPSMRSKLVGVGKPDYDITKPAPTIIPTTANQQPHSYWIMKIIMANEKNRKYKRHHKHVYTKKIFSVTQTARGYR